MTGSPPSPLVPPGTRLWVLGSGKVGHEVHCIGIARALGLEPEIRDVRPRRPFAWASPYGPVDPRDAPHRAGSAIAPPFPDIVFAAGQRPTEIVGPLLADEAAKLQADFWSARE